MVTSNVINRTFHIRMKGKSGTAFAVDLEEKQYLITARHVLQNVETVQTIDIFHEKRWKSLNVEVVGIGEGAIDIAVLACPVRLAPQFPLELGTKGLVYGQSVYFLGFPFGRDSGQEYVNRNFPVPFVKSGIVSALPFERPMLIYVDARGNRGFSGGPLVFAGVGGNATEFKVAGVIVHGLTPEKVPVVDERGDPIQISKGRGAYLFEDQGFVVAIDICHAVDLIAANPIGFEVPNGDAS